ncbi:hypothetical protein Tco_1303958 [Tanacetum coccineum]
MLGSKSFFGVRGHQEERIRVEERIGKARERRRRDLGVIRYIKYEGEKDRRIQGSRELWHKSTIRLPLLKDQSGESKDGFTEDGEKQIGTIFRETPYPFDYPTRRLTMEEILDKFIDEGKCKHKEMEIFIKEFRTTNELLLKERSNLLSELKIEVNELSKVMSNVLIPKNEVKGVTTRGGRMTSEATRSKEINETRINKNEPPRFEQDVKEKPHDDGVKNKSSSIRERTT